MIRVSIEQKRVIFLFFTLSALLSYLIVVFYKLQVIEYGKWSHLAKTQHRMVVQEMSHRGLFYANAELRPFQEKRKIPLVYDVARFHLHIDPGVIPKEHIEELAEGLSRLLIQKKTFFLEELQKISRSRRVGSFLSQKEKQGIEEWWFPLCKEKKISKRALFFIKDYKRSYPYEHLLGQLLHTCRFDEKERRMIPTGGLELAFDPLLQGSDGKRILLRTPRQRIEYDEIVEPAVNGADLYLTIDLYLQTVAEQALKEGVEKVKAKGGSILIMDPNNGQIFAMANYPFFNPAHYSDYYNHPDKLEATKNQVINATFEPGSIMKPITLAIALKANEELFNRKEPPLFSVGEKINVMKDQFPGRRKPIRDVGNHRFLDAKMAIQKSSNIYFARLVERIILRLGPAWYREQLCAYFQFGSKCGIELPSEAPGMVPKIGKQYQSGLLEWSVPTPFSLAIGYNLRVTQLQMARAYAMLINGGRTVHPTLINRVVDCSGRELSKKGQQTKKRYLSPSNHKFWMEAMELPLQPGGSSTRAAIKGYRVSGKTGTSEKIVKGVYSKQSHYASFIGFFPSTEPRCLIVIGVDEPEMTIDGISGYQYGGRSAAPIFAQVARAAVEYLGIKEDDPEGDALSQEIAQLKNRYREWNG